MVILSINNLTKRFGGVVALNGINLQLKEGSISGLIGPNGAGKTTLINSIIGLYTHDTGEIYFRNDRITDLRPHERIQKGISKTYQLLRVFPNVSVLDNLIIAGLCVYKDKEKLKENALKLLHMFNLDKLQDEYASNLSVGQTKLVDVARALINDPRLVLMDEPFHGIHPSFKEKICETVKELNEEKGMTFLLVSHDIPSIVAVCRRIVVLNAGVIIADGTCEEIRRNEEVIEAYLGA